LLDVNEHNSILKGINGYPLLIFVILVIVNKNILELTIATELIIVYSRLFLYAITVIAYVPEFE